jgi:hypothetical protein
VPARNLYYYYYYYYCYYYYYRKLIKTTIKTVRFFLAQIRVEENLKSRPKQFWKHVSQFRKKNADLTHFAIDGVSLNKPHDCAEGFSKHFQSVYSSSCSGTFPSANHCTEISSLAPISNSTLPLLYCQYLGLTIDGVWIGE